MSTTITHTSSTSLTVAMDRVGDLSRSPSRLCSEPAASAVPLGGNRVRPDSRRRKPSDGRRWLVCAGPRQDLRRAGQQHERVVARHRRPRSWTSKPEILRPAHPGAQPPGTALITSRSVRRLPQKLSARPPCCSPSIQRRCAHWSRCRARWFRGPSSSSSTPLGGRRASWPGGAPIPVVLLGATLIGLVFGSLAAVLRSIIKPPVHGRHELAHDHD